jgi:hypothetical protein
MDKSKMKAIRKHVRKTDLSVHNRDELHTAKRIYERNPDTGVIKSRKAGDYGNERIEYLESEIGAAGHHDGYTLEGLKNEKEYLQDKMDSMHYDIQGKVRREVLNELWAANKVNHNGHWYVRLSEVVNIIGDHNEE